MQTYVVYVDGKEAGYIKAAGHNAAEKKAQSKYKKVLNISDELELSRRISVSYTEI